MASYRLDMSKMTIRECFRLGGPFSPFLLLCKLVGHNLADQKVVALDIEELQHLSLEDVARRSSPTLRSLLEEADNLGLEHLFCYTLPPSEAAFSVVYLSSRPSCILEFISFVDGKKIRTSVGAISPKVGGGELITVLYPTKGMDPDPFDLVETLKFGGIQGLLGRHTQRQKKIDLCPLPPNEFIEDYLRVRNQRAVKRFVDRGLYVPV